MSLERVEAVEVQNWRNWQETTALDDLPAGLVVLSGPNAVGKTGLWEAVVLGLLDKHWGTHTSRLRPVGTKGVLPRARITFVAGGARYRVEKHFGGANARDKARFWTFRGGAWDLLDEGEEAYRLCRNAVLGEDGGVPTRGGADKALHDTLMQVLLPRQGALVEPAPTPTAVSMAVTDREAAAAATRLGRVLARVARESDAVWVGQRDRPRKGSDLQQGEERLAAIAAEVEPLEGKVERIGQVVQGLTAASEDRAALGDATERVAEADGLVREAREHREAREAAEARFREAHAKAERAEALHDQRTKLAAALGEAEAACQGAAAALETRAREQARLQTARQTAEQARAAQDTDLRALRAWIEYESRGSETGLRQRALADLAARLGAVQEAETDLREAETERAGLRLPTPEEWQAWDALDAARREAEGRLQAGAWSVRGTLPEGLTLTVDDAAVAGPEVDAEAVREVSLSAKDGATLRVSAREQDRREAERRRAEVARFLARYGVDSIRELRERDGHVRGVLEPRIAAAQRSIEQALGDGTREDLLREQVALEEAVRRMEAQDAPDQARPSGDLESWKVRLDVEDAEHQRTVDAAQAANADVAVATQAVVDATVTQARADEARDGARGALDAHRVEHGDDAVVQKTTAKAQVVRDEFEGSWRKLDEARAMAEGAKEERAENLKRGLQAVLEQEQRVRGMEAEVEALRREDPEGRLAALEAERVHLAERVRVERTQAEAIRLLEEALTAEQERLTEAIGGPIRERLQPWVRYLLQDDSEVVVEEDGCPAVISTPEGRNVPYEDQSFGTREQVSVLYRLAVADLVAGDGEAGVCLMLDDPFGHTDRGRRRRMLEILIAEAERRAHQILVFTCRPEDFEGAGHHVAVGPTTP